MLDPIEAGIRRRGLDRMGRGGGRNVFGPIEPRSRQAEGDAPAARPERQPRAAMADREARPAATEVDAQAGDEADAPIESKSHAELSLASRRGV